MNVIENIADEIIDRLKPYVIIHRYDAVTTNSIYLKFDYGIINSLRISDHQGKKHLNYRYNVISNQHHKEIIHQNGFDVFFYPPSQIDELCSEIIKLKKQRINQYYNYDAVINKVKNDIDFEFGFWNGAYQVN